MYTQLVVQLYMFASHCMLPYVVKINAAPRHSIYILIAETNLWPLVNRQIEFGCQKVMPKRMRRLRYTMARKLLCVASLRIKGLRREH